MTGKLWLRGTSRWWWIAVAGAYAAAVVLMADFVFGGNMFFPERAGPTRTGNYGARLPIAAPVDPGTLARAITEAGGGPPTIGLPLPMAQPGQAAPASQPVTVAAISPTTTPTYTAATRVTTLSYASLLALVPTNLTFPPRAHPRR